MSESRIDDNTFTHIPFLSPQTKISMEQEYIGKAYSEEIEATLYTSLYNLQESMSKNLQRQRQERRDLRKRDLNFLEQTHNNMADHHNTQAFLRAISFFGSLFKLATGGFDAGVPDQKQMIDTLTNFGDLTSKFGDLATQFNHCDKEKLDSKLEELRDLLAQDNKSESEIQQRIKEIHDMLNAAIEKTHKKLDSPFAP